MGEYVQRHFGRDKDGEHAPRQGPVAIVPQSELIQRQLNDYAIVTC